MTPRPGHEVVVRGVLVGISRRISLTVPMTCMKAAETGQTVVL